MSISLKEAGLQVGVTRQTLMKAIRNGRISAEKDKSGNWRIEPVELFRVWRPVNSLQAEFTPNLTGGDTPSLQVEIDLLRAQLSDREALIYELRNERNEWREQAKSMRLLTDQRTAKVGFWSRLRGRS